jgi:hypothetical protein
MLDEVRPALLNADAYASVDDLLTMDDLHEQDVTIKRWHRNGKALKLRVKALNLEQQDAIYQASMVKNKKTGEWETARLVFCAETLTRSVRMPSLDTAQAQALARKNPVIINALVDFIWALAALDAETLEAAAHAMAPPDPNAEPGDNAGTE